MWNLICLGGVLFSEGQYEFARHFAYLVFCFVGRKFVSMENEPDIHARRACEQRSRGVTRIKFGNDYENQLPYLFGAILALTCSLPRGGAARPDRDNESVL